ncbi:MAG: polyprenol monophosphomannose synthase [Chloroflexota bacterium]|nr:MAG: polyprenol monophosphomannose synthase [Chloroflexota bacterium]
MESIVVIPTYNEAGNVSTLISAILDLGQFDVLIVDDNSPDGTGELADALAGEHPGRVHVLHRQTKTGLGRAYVDGFARALKGPYQYVLQMDADLSHDPGYLPTLLETLRSGEVDVVIGSRYASGGGTVGWPFKRRMLSWGGSLYARLVLGLKVRDVTGGFKGFRRVVLESLNLDRIRSNGYAFQIEVNFLCNRQGFRLAEVPIVFRERQIGASKLSKAIFWEALITVLRLRLGDWTFGRLDLRTLAVNWRHWFSGT